ncbi:MAG: DMT family transporter [Rhodobacter sp.]|nr:DMT family transporter [Rhodobacter sp.]
MSTTPASPLLAPGAPSRTNNTLGLAYMALGMFLFSAVDAQGKLLTATLHPIQIVWCRQLGLLFAVAILLAVRGTQILKTANPKLQIARGAVAAGSATTFIVAVGFVPLADAVAVSFVAPFIVTVLGALILREHVGVRRWTAVTIGFLATLIVIRPGLGVLHPAIFLVIVAATLFAVRQIISRWLSGSDRTVTTVAYTSLVGSAILTIPLPFVWKWPATGLEYALLASIAVLAGIAETMVIKALEVAQAVVVAPVQYTLLIFGTFYGWLIFAELPDAWTLSGALIIVATGLYTLQRERLATRRMTKEDPK